MIRAEHRVTFVEGKNPNTAQIVSFQKTEWPQSSDELYYEFRAIKYSFCVKGAGRLNSFK